MQHEHHLQSSIIVFYFYLKLHLLICCMNLWNNLSAVTRTTVWNAVTLCVSNTACTSNSEFHCSACAWRLAGPGRTGVFLLTDWRNSEGLGPFGGRRKPRFCQKYVYKPYSTPHYEPSKSWLPFFLRLWKANAWSFVIWTKLLRKQGWDVCNKSTERSLEVAPETNPRPLIIVSLYPFTET